MTGSVTRYIAGLRRGDQEATQKIWERFLRRLITLADRKLKSYPRKAVDEEDMVQLAFADFFRQVRRGRFPKLNDRYDLWQVLAMLVDRRSRDQIRKMNTIKAGAGRVISEIGCSMTGNTKAAPMAGLVDVAPTPDLAAEFAEEFGKRLDELKSPEYREIALLKMQGFTNREIATRVCLALRTVERRLMEIRSSWNKRSSSITSNQSCRLES